MKPRTAKSTPMADLSGDAPGPEEVRVGKDVVELITSGMYVSPTTVFREYVQNAADAADAAREAGLLLPSGRGSVDVTLDHRTRSVLVRDDGVGIPAGRVADVLLAVGGSAKRGSGARGFRGVGRLSGLAYCRELEFRTKAKGERRVSSVVWDCRALRNHLADGTFGGDVRHLISKVVRLDSQAVADPGEHFFEVHMRDVARHRNDLVLNEKAVAHYLAQVAPVPHAEGFSHGKEIEARLAGLGAKPPVDLRVNGEPVSRLYRDETTIPGTGQQLAIRNLEWVEFADVDGGVAAVGWLGHHDYVRSIPVGLGVRGLRARVGDVQVGDANLFDECFREPRFNGWCVGEVHVLDRRVVPNARRDNFELNHHAYNLLAQLGPIAGRVANRCRSASVSRNIETVARNVIADVERRTSDGRTVDSVHQSRLAGAIARCRGKLKGISDDGLRTLVRDELDDAERLLSGAPSSEGPAAVSLDEALALVTKVVTNREQARRLIEALRGLHLPGGEPA